MLTFEKVLKVFQAYLEDDPLYEHWHPGWSGSYG